MRVFGGTTIRFLAFLGAFLLVLTPIFVSAASISQLQKKREALSREIQRNKELAAQKKKEAQELTRIISQLDKDIANTQAKINRTQSQIAGIQNQINQILAQIAQKEKELAVEQENQNEVLRVLYETVDKDILEILIGSESLSEVITYGQYLEALEIKIENTIAEIERLKNELETKKGELEKKKRELERLRIELQVQRDNLAEQRRVKDALLGQTKAEEKALKEKIAQAQKEKQQIEAQLAAAAKKYSGPRFYGEWALPLPPPLIVTAEFHDPSYPFRHIIGEHTGIDLRAAQGTPVYAVGDGVVTTVAYPLSPALAYLFIDHGNNISTGYLHLSAIFVSPGQIVKKGQNIGLSGGTPGTLGAGALTTGPHLHLEFRVNNIPVNPRAYLEF